MYNKQDIKQYSRLRQFGSTDKGIFRKSKPQFNQEVINTLFIGKTLVWNRSRIGRRYEVRVEEGGIFVDNKTGQEIAKSPSMACKVLSGGGSHDGWRELKVCLDPQEGWKTLSYYRSKFFSRFCKLRENAYW